MLTMLRLAALILPMAAGLLLGVAPAAATPLTLTGDYLQVGISDYGTFGSDGSTEPGILHDPTGTRDFYPGGIANDYLTPGDPHDGFAINSLQTGLVINDNHGTVGGINSFGTASPTLLTGAAANGYDSAAAWTVTYGDYLTVDTRYFFRKGDERILIQTTITAHTLLTNVAFGRSEDPDPDVARFGSYDTVNTRGDTSTAPQDLVSAAGSQTGLTLGILNGSGNTYSHNTEITSDCCDNDDPYNVLSNSSTLGYPQTVTGDYGLQMAWSLGNMLPGQSLTILYSYVFGTHQGTVSESGPTIDTTDGDIKPNVFSLGSSAAKASTVIFEGGILRMIGGDFAGDIVPSPVTIDTPGGTVDTSTGNGGFSGVVSGPGALTIVGGGAFGMANSNTFQGGTNVVDSTLTIGRGTSLGSGSVALTGGVLQVAAGAQIALNNTVVVNGGGALDSNGGSLTLNKAVSGSGLLAFANTGGTYGSDDRSFGNSIILTQTSPFSGGSALLDQSFVSLRATDALGTGSLAVLQGGQLDLGGNDQTVVSLSGQGVITNTGVSSSSPSGALNRLTVSAGSFGGVIEDGHYTNFDDGSGVLRDTQGFIRLVKQSDGTASGGTLTLTGANTYSGGTALDAGTLAVGSNGALGTGALVMARGTTLAFVADGLRVANGIAFAEAGDPTFDTGSNAVTLTGPISGPGDLDKIGSGTLDLAGANTYVGDTLVRQGTLLVDGSTVSTATVFSGAQIGGTGIIGGLNVLNGGTLAPGSGIPYSTLRIAGNTTFAPGSVFAVDIDASGRSDSVTIGGAAAIQGGTVTVSPASGVYTVANRYTLLTANGGRTGEFSALSAPDFAFLTPALSYDASHVYLGFAQTAAFGSAATTPNQQATAGAIGSLGPGNPLYDIVLVQTPSGAQQAFQSASGEAHASVPSVAVTGSRFISDAVIGRLWNIPVIGGGDAISVLDQFGTVTTNPLLRCYSPDETGGGVVPSTYTVWGQAVGDFGRNGGDGNAQTVDRTLAGFALGIDTRVDAKLLDNWRVGVAGGYTSDDFSLSRGGGHGTYENVFGTLYGGARYGVIDVRLGASYGGTTTDTRRTVAFPGFNEAERARYGGDTALGFGEIGYRFAFPRTVIEPVIDGSVTNVHQDGYREKGGVAALVSTSEDTLVGTTTLGFRGEVTPFDGVRFVSRVFLGWQHSYGDINPAATLAFASGSAAFNVYGTAIDRNAAVAETDFVWRATDAMSLSLAYTGQIGPRDHDNAVRGRADYRF